MKKIGCVLLVIFALQSVSALAQGNKNKEKEKDKKNNSSKSSSSNSSSASDKNSGVGCFNESSKIINIGIGFGSRGYYSYNRGILGYSYHSSPAISLSYEQALKQKVGPGYLGVGAYLGYQSAYLQYDNYYYNNNKYYYRHSWKYMLFSARAAYHLDELNFEKGELYFGAIIGLRYQSYSYETNSIDPNRYDYQLSNNSLYPSWSLFVGGRYYFTPKIAVFGELGYGISYLTGGISFKL